MPKNEVILLGYMSRHTQATNAVTVRSDRTSQQASQRGACEPSLHQTVKENPSERGMSQEVAALF